MVWSPENYINTLINIIEDIEKTDIYNETKICNYIDDTDYYKDGIFNSKYFENLKKLSGNFSTNY